MSAWMRALSSGVFASQSESVRILTQRSISTRSRAAAALASAGKALIATDEDSGMHPPRFFCPTLRRSWFPKIGSRPTPRAFPHLRQAVRRNLQLRQHQNLPAGRDCLWRRQGRPTGFFSVLRLGRSRAGFPIRVQTGRASRPRLEEVVERPNASFGRRRRRLKVSPRSRASAPTAAWAWVPSRRPSRLPPGSSHKHAGLHGIQGISHPNLRSIRQRPQTSGWAPSARLPVQRPE